MKNKYINISDFKILETSNKPPMTSSYACLMGGFPRIWPETKGAGMKLAVIDTGFSKHKNLEISQAPDIGLGYEDKNIHGTWCLGAAGARGDFKGALPEVELISIKAFNDKGQAEQKHIMKALEWCGANDVDAVSMSFGGSKSTDSAYHRAIKELDARGVFLSAAAGNMGDMFPGADTIMYPAEYPEVVATTSINMHKDFSYYSSSGKQAEIAMAGQDVWGLGLNNSYAQLSGTSMVAPLVACAGLAIKARAGIRLNRELTNAETRLILQLMAKDYGPKGWDEKFGFGVFSFGDLVDVRMAVGSNKYQVYGRDRKMDAAPIIIDSRTYVPIRFMSEATGATVDYDSAKKEVKVLG